MTTEAAGLGLTGVRLTPEERDTLVDLLRKIRGHDIGAPERPLPRLI